MGAFSMKKSFLSTLLISFLFITTNAHAGLLIEPVLGYNVSAKFKLGTDDSSEEKGKGLSYGGRLGFQRLGLSGGLDYLQSTIAIDENDYDSDLKSQELGLFVGYRFPVLLKVYAGYILSANGESKYDDGVDAGTLKVSKGTGTKIGVGFTGMPFIDLNFEYRKIVYSEFEIAGFEVSEDTDFSSFLVSLSLPLDF